MRGALGCQIVYEVAEGGGGGGMSAVFCHRSPVATVGWLDWQMVVSQRCYLQLT